MTVQVKASADNTYGALQVNGIDKVYFGKTGDNLEAVTNSTLTSYSQRSLTAAVATTSGTAIDFTGIPSWAKRVTLLLDGVSSNGTSVFQIQLGTSSGADSAGYSSHVFRLSNTSLTSNTSAATGFACQTGNAAVDTLSGKATLTLRSGFMWDMDAMFNTSSGGFTQGNNGQKTLSGVLDRVRLTTQNGTDTFDAGSVSLLIEG